ncbi:MAG: DEAD/DEAH box helicase [Candidatus Caldarchaeum sp.]|nr:DEAD/DEAH box helicase [Candidatus Caldarchaeum sp.]
MGYDFHKFVSKAVKPGLVSERFSDLLPGLRSAKSLKGRGLAGKQLYVHQKQALDALLSGENLVLKAGTGSGKTEAWFLYTAQKKVRTLAVYPTLALSNDQMQRLADYCADLGMKQMPIDALRKQEYINKIGSRALRNDLASSDIVITNPAYLLNELKRIAFSKPSFIKDFLANCGLVVLDEFDFYGPRSISILLTMMKLVVELINPAIQLVVMTATLQDPYEVAEMLSKINGRKTSVVDGEAFHAENRAYLILGKSLEKVWSRIRGHREKLEDLGAGPDVLKCLNDFDYFRRNFFKLVDTAEAAGVEVKEFFEDPAEVLRHYAEDDALTLVFTNSIAAAEEMARRVSMKLGIRRRLRLITIFSSKLSVSRLRKTLGKVL